MIKNICKIIGIIIFLLFMGHLGSSAGLFAGFLYPDKAFGFTSLGDAPPFNAGERLSLGSKYPQVFNILIMGGGNSFNYHFLTSIFVNHPYEVLHIKKMKYKWDEGEGILSSDKIFDLYGYQSKNGWFWTQRTGGSLYNGNLANIFKGKKVGDTFSFTLEIEFSLDNEPVQTQILEYRVIVVKNSYISPFYF